MHTTIKDSIIVMVGFICQFGEATEPRYLGIAVKVFLKFFNIVFIVVLGGGTLWHLQNFLQCIEYIIFEFIPSKALLYALPPPIPRIVSAGINFAFPYIHIQFLYHIPLPIPFLF
jgi:hypothetical protein